MGEQEDLRLQALAQAVASGALGTEEYVERAKAFYAFLSGTATTESTTTLTPVNRDLIFDGSAHQGGTTVTVTVVLEPDDQYPDEHELGEIVGAHAATILRAIEQQRDRARMPQF